MPELPTLLIGDGKYTMPGGYYYMSTDVGFMRAILYFGIFGCLLNYLLPLTFECAILRRSRGDKALRWTMLALTIVFVVLEMKGEAYHRMLLAVMPIYYLIQSEEKPNGKTVDRHSHL